MSLSGTATTAANLILALTMPIAPQTVSPMPSVLEAKQARSIPKNTSRLSLVASPQLPTMIANESNYEESSRPTTSLENVIGEIRRWSLLDADWDGEGAAAPEAQSIKEAVSFVRLLDGDIALPEPMLLGSGHAALYWNEGGLYADLEFLGDGRIAYFIKNDGDKHKGVLSFDPTDMPAVFPALIGA